MKGWSIVTKTVFVVFTMMLGLKTGFLRVNEKAEHYDYFTNLDKEILLSKR